MRMGLREANQSFSKAIKAVKPGKDVVLTERGKPVAVIKPLRPEKDANSVLRQLETEGVLRRGSKSGKPMPAWRTPVPTVGRSRSASFEQSRRVGYDRKSSDLGCDPHRVRHDHSGFLPHTLAVYQRRWKATRSGAKLQAKRDRNFLKGRNRNQTEPLTR